MSGHETADGISNYGIWGYCGTEKLYRIGNKIVRYYLDDTVSRRSLLGKIGIPIIGGLPNDYLIRLRELIFDFATRDRRWWSLMYTWKGAHWRCAPGRL